MRRCVSSVGCRENTIITPKREAAHYIMCFLTEKGRASWVLIKELSKINEGNNYVLGHTK